MTETTSKPGHFEMHEFKLRQLEVAAVEELNPRYKRITFTSEDLADFTSLSPEDHAKLAFFPDGEPVLPTRGESGWIWPEGKQPELRDYTPRAYNNEKRELIVDFVIHGEGTASNWAAQAQPGHRVGMAGPRGSYVLDKKFDWYLLIGDETVIPSIQRHLEEFPKGTRVLTFIEVNDAADELPLPTECDATISWIHRGDAGFGTDLLEQAVRNAEFPNGEMFVFAGGEATSLRGIRRYLKNELEIPIDHLSFSGHWKVGVTDFDHHTPIEE